MIKVAAMPWGQGWPFSISDAKSTGYPYLKTIFFKIPTSHQTDKYIIIILNENGKIIKALRKKTWKDIFRIQAR